MLVAILLLSVQSHDTLLTATFRERWRRGNDNDTVVSFVSLTPNYVAVGPNNHVFLLDRERGRVVELDPSGQRIRTLGRSGNGPGELANPVSLTVAPTGTVLVYDFARRGFVGWSGEGSPLPTLPFPGLGIPNSPHALTDTTVLFSTTSPDSARLYRLTRGSLTTVAAFPVAPPKRIGDEVCGVLGYQLPPIFSPSLAWANWGDQPVATFGDQARVSLPSGEGSIRSWAAPRSSRPATRAMAVAQLGQARTLRPDQPACRFPAERIVDAVGVWPYLPAYQRLVASSPDTLWALRYAVKGEPMFADLFSRSAGYLGTVSLGQISPVAFLSDGRVLSLEPAEDDIPTVAVYAVSVRRR